MTKYFVAVFGDPQLPEKDAVESGVYHPNSKDAPFTIKPGDMMILYCTKGYAQHQMEVPGLGITLHVDDQCIKYRYLPFDKAIPMATIEDVFEPGDAKKFGARRFDHFWLFEISQISFLRAIGLRTINWDKL